MAYTCGKDLSKRKDERVGYERPGFIIPAPDAPWIECFITDVSDSGICLNGRCACYPGDVRGRLYVVRQGAQGLYDGLETWRTDRRALRHGERASERSATSQDRTEAAAEHYSARMTTYTIHASKGGQSVQTVRISPTVTVAKARVLLKSGSTYY